MAIHRKTEAVGLGGRVERFRRRSLWDAMALAGFDPDAVGSAWIAVLTDIHYTNDPNIYRRTVLDPVLQEECLKLSVHPPNYITINGDLCSYWVPSMGSPPDFVSGEIETDWAAVGIDLLETVAPVRMVLGNHDTYQGENPPGVFMASKIPQFQYGYFSEVLGGVRCAWLNLTCGGDLVTDHLDLWKGDIGTLTAGQEMVSFHHHPSFGDVSQAGMMTAYRSAEADFPALSNKLWSVAGHAHVFGDNIYSLAETTLTVWHITCGLNVIPDSSDITAPGMGAICLRDGQVVARFAMDCKNRFWYLWDEVPWSAPTPVFERTHYVTGVTTLVQYIEGEYTRNATNGPTNAAGAGTWLDRGSWTGSSGNYRMKFVVPGAATGLWILTDESYPIEISSDGSNWTSAALISRINGVAKYSLPVPLRGLSPLHLKLTSGCNYGGCGFY